MGQYLLSAHSYVREVAGRAVFLDLKRDKFTGLECDDVRILRKLVRGWPVAQECVDDVDARETRSTAIVDILLAEGLLTQDQVAGKEANPVVIDAVTETIDNVRAPYPSLTFGDFGKFVRAWLATTAMIQILPLQAVVRRVQRRKARRGLGGGTFDVHKAHRLTTIYFMLRANFFSPVDACLRDSLTFVEFFALYGMYPTWVFGVKMEPFAAHSWVQEGPMVLNDYIAHVTRFAPILAV